MLLPIGRLSWLKYSNIDNFHFSIYYWDTALLNVGGLSRIMIFIAPFTRQQRLTEIYSHQRGNKKRENEREREWLILYLFWGNGPKLEGSEVESNNRKKKLLALERTLYNENGVL